MSISVTSGLAEAAICARCSVTSCGSAAETERPGQRLPSEVQYLQLDYTKLVPVLIKALQDVKREKDAEVEALKASDAALQAENAALKARLHVLEGIILTPEARAAAADAN